MRLTGTLYNAGGPLANVTVVFEATATTMNGVLYSADAQFTTQEDGTYVIDLEAGLYNVYWIERGHRVRLGTVTADPFSEASLPEVLQADPTPVDSSAIQDEILEALNQMAADLATSAELRDETAGLRDEAQQAVTDARDYRDGAAVAGQVYADTAAGLAAVGDGDYFKTPAADDEGFLTLWQRQDASTAQPIDTYPSLNGLTAAIQAANEQATRLNRSFSMRPYNGESLRADFEAQGYGLGDTTGISRAVGEGEMFTVQRATPKRAFQRVVGGAIQLVEVPPDTLAHEWDAATGDYLGVLIEGARSNKVIFSEDMSTSWWNHNGVTPTLLADGSFRFSEAETDEPHNVATPNFGFSVGDDITFSADIKADGVSIVKLEIGGPRCSANIDLASGVVNSVSSSTDEYVDIYADVRLVSDGFYRCWITATKNEDAADYCRIEFAGGPHPGEPSDSFVTRRWMLERGGYPSGYIPTYGISVTRAEDQVPRDMGGQINELGGVFYWEGDVSRSSVAQALFFLGFDNGNRIALYHFNNRILVRFQVDDQGDDMESIAVPYGKIKVALSYNLIEGGYYVSVNGGAARQASCNAIPATKTLYLGSSQSGSTQMTGHIKHFEYIPESRTAAQVEEMTA